jgi:hypothetical protein
VWTLVLSAGLGLAVGYVLGSRQGGGSLAGIAATAKRLRERKLAEEQKAAVEKAVEEALDRVADKTTKPPR